MYSYLCRFLSFPLFLCLFRFLFLFFLSFLLFPFPSFFFLKSFRVYDVILCFCFVFFFLSLSLHTSISCSFFSLLFSSFLAGCRSSWHFFLLFPFVCQLLSIPSSLDHFQFFFIRFFFPGQRRHCYDTPLSPPTRYITLLTILLLYGR